MSRCPSCGHVNIEGVDECEQCEQPFADLHLADVAGPVEGSLLSDRVSVLRPKPRTVAPDVAVGEVLKIMAGEAIGCVLVVAGRRLVGIFSERDALMRLNTDAAELAGRPVSEFMTPQPECLEPDAKIAFAVQRMDLGGYRHVPIVDREGLAVGVISVRDILQYLTSKMRAADGV
jgi:CBS domain-containing protein